MAEKVQNIKINDYNLNRPAERGGGGAGGAKSQGPGDF